jgi:hypothetical protein
VVLEETNSLRVDVRTPQLACDRGEALVQQLSSGKTLFQEPGVHATDVEDGFAGARSEHEPMAPCKDLGFRQRVRVLEH